MTERIQYQPTRNQERKWAKEAEKVDPMPSDDEFKAAWAKSHGGKVRGWGLAKRDWILHNMTKCRDYQMGLWQGRVDCARGLDYAEERNDNAYNLGYYRGYSEYESNRRGWDQATRDRFDAKYVK